MRTYEVILNRVVEHKTIYNVLASNEEEAEELVLSGNNYEITDDSEIGEWEDPEVLSIKAL